MKKVFGILIVVISLMSFSKVKADDAIFSEWSRLYPDGLMSNLIKSEDRYHFYRLTSDGVEYTDEYYTELEGYIKDEASKVTYYSYLTNGIAVFNNKGELLLNYYDYCKKNYCYVKLYDPPVMIDVSDKEVHDYTGFPMMVDDRYAIPMTGDNIYAYLGLFVSGLLIIYGVFKRYI